MSGDAIVAALTRLDRSIDAVDAATSNVELWPNADDDNALRKEVRAAIAELDAMLGRAHGRD